MGQLMQCIESDDQVILICQCLAPDLDDVLRFCRNYTGEGNGDPLQYSCLENPMDGGAWQAAVHGDMTERLQFHFSLSTFMHWRRKWQPTPVFLPGESQGRQSLVGCHLWGGIESDTTEATQQQQQQELHTDGFQSNWALYQPCVLKLFKNLKGYPVLANFGKG